MIFESLDHKIKQYKIITNKESEIGKSKGQFIFIDVNSNLGKILFNKCLGDEFEFGKIKYKINEITLNH